MSPVLSRRRFLGGMLGAVALAAAERSLAGPTLVNPCRVPIPLALLDSPWLRQAWQGIDPAQVWDCHVHIAGLGDGGSGIEVGPELTSLLHPMQYAQRLFYMNAGCTHNAPGQVDGSYVARLLNLTDAMPAGFKVMLFAFERFHDENGLAHAERTTFHVPDAWAKKLATDYPQRFEWVASIHPYRKDAVDALQAAISSGARAVKWLPAAMGMDPASPRCAAFYRLLADSRTPLIVHCGEEKAVKGGDTQPLGNPLLLRAALDAGVRVVVAHSASLGSDVDSDRGANGPRLPSIDLFIRLLGEARAKGLLFGDISAITQRNRKPALIRRLLERDDLHASLLNGSDYPLPGVLPLTSAATLARNGLLPSGAVADLEAIRQHNPLLFDFVLKRLLTWQGHSFPVSVFHARLFFQGGKA